MQRQGPHTLAERQKSMNRLRSAAAIKSTTTPSHQNQAQGPSQLHLIAKHNAHRSAFETILSRITENTVLVRPIFTSNPLVSASLLGELQRHEIVRNQEGGDNMGVVKRVLAVCDPQQSHWRYQLDQAARVEQYRAGIARIDRRIECIKRLMRIPGECGSNAYDKELQELQHRRRSYETVMQYIRPHAEGTTHPDGSPDIDPLATDGSPDKTVFDGWRVRGIYVRMAGPRKATKAGYWRRSAGAISINSVDFVNAEEYKVQVPSRTGTYGLTVRIVWGLTAEMPGKKTVFHDGVRPFQPVDKFSNLL